MVPGTIVRAGVDVPLRGARSRRRPAHAQRRVSRAAARSRSRRASCPRPGLRRARCASCTSSRRARRFCFKTMPIACRASGGAAPGGSGAAAASGMSFCARAQAEPFRRARLLPPDAEIFEIPELTSSFSPGDARRRARRDGAARRPRGPLGRPPRREQGSSDRARGRERRRARSTGLAALVLLRNGAVAGGRRSAHRARRHAPRLACTCWAACRTSGSSSSCARPTCSCSAATAKAAARRSSKRWPRASTPVVTDIPSSRALTGNGAVGALWPCGDCARARNRAATRRGDATGPRRARGARPFRRTAVERRRWDESSPPHTPAHASGRLRRLRAWSRHERGRSDRLVARARAPDLAAAGRCAETRMRCRAADLDRRRMPHARRRRRHRALLRRPCRSRPSSTATRLSRGSSWRSGSRRPTASSSGSASVSSRCCRSRNFANFLAILVDRAFLAKRGRAHACAALRGVPASRCQIPCEQQ